MNQKGKKKCEKGRKWEGYKRVTSAEVRGMPTGS